MGLDASAGLAYVARAGTVAAAAARGRHVLEGHDDRLLAQAAEVNLHAAAHVAMVDDLELRGGVVAASKEAEARPRVGVAGKASM